MLRSLREGVDLQLGRRQRPGKSRFDDTNAFAQLDQKALRVGKFRGHQSVAAEAAFDLIPAGGGCQIQRLKVRRTREWPDGARCGDGSGLRGEVPACGEKYGYNHPYQADCPRLLSLVVLLPRRVRMGGDWHGGWRGHHGWHRWRPPRRTISKAQHIFARRSIRAPPVYRVRSYRDARARNSAASQARKRLSLSLLAGNPALRRSALP